MLRAPVAHNKVKRHLFSTPRLLAANPPIPDQPESLSHRIAETADPLDFNIDLVAAGESHGIRHRDCHSGRQHGTRGNRIVTNEPSGQRLDGVPQISCVPGLAEARFT